MPSLPSGQPYNAVWKFHSNAHTRGYRLTVIYYSNQPPNDHEAIHYKLREQAFQWLIGQGHQPDPEKVQIIICRLDQDDEVVADPIPGQIPNPIPVVPISSGEEAVSRDKVVELK